MHPSPSGQTPGRAKHLFFLTMPIAAILFSALCATLAYKAELGQAEALSLAVAILVIWILFQIWLVSAFRRGSAGATAVGQPGPATPNPGFERTLLTILGVVFLVILALSGVYGYVFGVSRVSPLCS